MIGTLRLASRRADTETRTLRVLAVAYGALGLTAIAVAMRQIGLLGAIQLPIAPQLVDPMLAGLVVWTVVCLGTSTQRARGADQVPLVFSTGPIMAAALLGGPVAAGWVALLGTTELRELRGRVPWYGVIASHGMHALSATVAAVLMLLVRQIPGYDVPVVDLVAVLIATGVWVVMVESLGLMAWCVRTGRPASAGFGIVSRADWNVAALADACLAWLAAIVYWFGLWWSPVVIIVTAIAAGRSLAHHEASWRLRHNDVTDLPNGLALKEHGRRLARGRSTGPLRILYLDLDGFKAVNDDHDHAVGDDVLREVGRRLVAGAGLDVFVAHLHGDEFAALAEGLADDEAAARMAAALVALVEPPIEHAVGELRVSATVGHAPVADPADLREPMKAADRQMQARKAAKARLAGRDRRRS